MAYRDARMDDMNVLNDPYTYSRNSIIRNPSSVMLQDLIAYKVRSFRVFSERA